MHSDSLIVVHGQAGQAELGTGKYHFYVTEAVEAICVAEKQGWPSASQVVNTASKTNRLATGQEEAPSCMRLDDSQALYLCMEVGLFPKAADN